MFKLACELRLLFGIFMWSTLASGGLLNAEDAKESAELPRIALCNPLLVESGTKTELVIRGWHLSDATEVKCDLEDATITILKQEAAPVPGRQDAKEIGDTQLRVEITIPAVETSRQMNLVVKTPAGESEPHTFHVGAQSQVIREKEPNNGFQQSQSLSLPAIITGDIQSDREVDVYLLEAKQGQRLKADILARRYGSALDSILTLYAEDGEILESIDDVESISGSANSDSMLEVILPRSGRFFLCIQDAHDRGGPAHPYIINVELNEQ